METQVADETENFDDEFYEPSNYELNEYEEKTETIENRLENLKKSMTSLKDEIKLEKELWQKESEIFIENKQKELKEKLSDVKIPKLVEPSLTDPSLLDYEKKLSMYHATLVKSHFEKRLKLRKHLIADAYKKRLFEIENMCNVELLKVKQSVQNLRPLQAIASQWKLDDEITGVCREKRDTDSRDTLSVTSDNKPNSEVKDILVYNSPTMSSLATASSAVHEEEEDSLRIGRIQSMGWYNNEVNYRGYNPYFLM